MRFVYCSNRSASLWKRLRIVADIPALTEMDDLTSKAVMQQYDENPYPRWTINPCKAVAGDMERHAPTIGTNVPQPSQDILIAGCGTGKHPFWIAQYFPNGRILAIDLSRANLAYARRKTREEGLQNIEYAQADILKLGGIGRTFDRIDAVGVLIIWQILKPDGASCSRCSRRLGLCALVSTAKRRGAM